MVRHDCTAPCGLHQRSMFGAEATAALPYVECAADGYQSAAATCRQKAEVEGYPTWEIGGKYYGGFQSLEELARLSGFGSASAAAARQGSDLGIDMSGLAPVVRNGEDCDLKTGDCT